MTDREKLVSLFTELQIQFTEEKDGTIKLEDSNENSSLSSSTEFDFYDDGKFYSVGIY